MPLTDQASTAGSAEHQRPDGLSADEVARIRARQAEQPGRPGVVTRDFRAIAVCLPGDPSPIAPSDLRGPDQGRAAAQLLASQGWDHEDLLTLAMSLEHSGAGASDGVLDVIEQLEREQPGEPAREVLVTGGALARDWPAPQREREAG